MRDQLHLDNQQPILKNHTVFGHSLLPGLAYIDLLYQICRDKGLDFAALELTNLTIYRPLIIDDESGIELKVSFKENKPGLWKISVEGRKAGRKAGTKIGKKENPDEETLLYAAAGMNTISPLEFIETLDIQSFIKSALNKSSLSSVYKAAREQQLVHSGIMKAEGTIYEKEDETLIHISPGPGALESADRFMFHPVLLDGSAMGAAGLLRSFMQEDKMFLPLYFEYFYSPVVLQGPCYVRIKKSSIYRKNELIYLSLDFFNESGQKIAGLKNLAVKMVRDSQLITSAAEQQTREETLPDKPGVRDRQKNETEQQDFFAGPDQSPREGITLFLRTLLAGHIGTGIEDIDSNGGYYEMGLDSQSLLEIVNTLEERTGESFSPTLLFEYTTINELAAYLAENHAGAFIEKREINAPNNQTGNQTGEQTEKKPEQTAPDNPAEVTGPCLNDSRQETQKSRSGDIAVIGMANRFPSSGNHREFWDNLLEGKDCITEIPKERWDWKKFSFITSMSGRPISKWGGFIDNADCFDPRFFRISPAEAEIMDPQERLFLQTCWEALEDSGYTPETLVLPRGENSRRPVGVFAGVMHKDYSLIGAEAIAGGNTIPLSLNYASIPNRVSYFCNFHGPSLAVDTVCSSSLTAVHMAIESIQNGSCEAAIAGGVNLSLHPDKYISYGLVDMHSSDGRCRTFGKGGDGYVSAEGVGAVILKPLEKAVSDNDHIYGVIKGSIINHCGAGSGITVPNPVAQAQMIQDCLDKTGISPESITYIETHGTGTSLGDPIEIKGLVKAFSAYTDKKSFCSIGSVKSNIGHAEAAAGISGLSKVLLQLDSKTLVPSLHSREINPYLQLQETPFYIQHKTAAWKRENNNPLRAGVSSFGASGSNAFVLVEEYIPPACAAGLSVTNRPGTKDPQDEIVIIPLSAKNSKSLTEYCRRLADFIKDRFLKDNQSETSVQNGRGNLADLAYTLQTGRRQLEQRVAFVVKNSSELLNRLNEFTTGQKNIPGCFTGKVKPGSAPEQTGTDKKQAENQTRETIARLWTEGRQVDWEQIYTDSGEKPHKMSLPTYPFALERYWIPGGTGKNGLLSPAAEIDTKKEEKRGGIITYREEWEEWEEREEKPAVREEAEGAFSLKTVICFLAKEESIKSAREIFGAQTGVEEIIFIRPGGEYKKQNIHSYTINIDDPGTYTEAFKAIKEDFGTINGVLYLYALEEAAYRFDYKPLIAILKAFKNSRLFPGLFLTGGNAESPQERWYLESWIGFERSLKHLLSTTRIVPFLSINTPVEEALTMVGAELQTAHTSGVLYEKNRRYVCSLKKIDLVPGKTILRQGGTYLITGGLGGIGYAVAEHLSRFYQARLILLGRSEPDGSKKAAIQKLESLGGRVLYIRGDISSLDKNNPRALEELTAFGTIHGVIHAAGINGTQTILDKSFTEFANVLAPKVEGTLVLDRIFAQENPDFICFFSSTAGILGDFGSCDYAVANRFETAYARYRQEEAQAGGTSVKTIAINWPLWREGGMSVGDKESSLLYLKSSGQRYLETAEGIDFFEKVLSSDPGNCTVFAGEASSIKSMLEHYFSPPDRTKNETGRLETKPLTPQNSPLQVQPVDRDNREAVEKEIIFDIKNIICDLLKLSPEHIDLDESYADFGFDSISLAGFAGSLADHYNLDLTPSLFFSYSTVRTLSGYFLEEHADHMAAFYHKKSAPAAARLSEERVFTAPKTGTPKETAVEINKSPVSTVSTNSPDINEPIAVIGMSGRFPGAPDIGTFWNNLKEGKSGITEIPSSRWDWRSYYGDPFTQPGKSLTKTGAFLNNIDKFDPLFFEISPGEAELMDPKQRLFLEEAWHTLEDAGYMGGRIKGASCGVFAGVEESEYAGLSDKNSGQNAMMPARIAYKLDLKGPNMVVNAACSSGLAAIHQACNALHQGDCTMALAGAVNIIISPLVYYGLARAGMLSPQGECNVFDNRADGLVPGEAVAAVLLKPLSLAVADNDHIYGCIKASGINYDGKTNGIAAPSPLSQAGLIASIYKKHSIDPEKIGYILTHSVGSSLGDPIEIEALSSAFRRYTRKKQFCKIGSVKPLLGHTFAASGIVNLIGMLLAINHKTRPGLPGYKQHNNFINPEKTPFIFENTTCAWETSNDTPRMGVISTTGVSGTNAHAVIEEYLPRRDEYERPQEKNSELSTPDGPQVILFSAKNREPLETYCKHFLTFLETGPDLLLSDIAYTLSVCREAMDVRLGFMVTSKQELKEVLQAIIDGNKPPRTLFRGETGRFDPALEVFTGDEDLQNALENWIAKKKYEKILDLWVKGLSFDWQSLYGNRKKPPVSLPLYPFEGERYWFEETETAGEAEKTQGHSGISPLLHRNTSNFYSQQFTSTFRTADYFLSGHMVMGKPLLPGAVCLEAARAAAAYSLDEAASVERTGDEKEKKRQRMVLKDIIWARPLVPDEKSMEVRLELGLMEENRISFNLYRTHKQTEQEDEMCCQGEIYKEHFVNPPKADIEALQKKCSKQRLSSAEIYRMFESYGICYGPALQGIRTMYVGDGQVLAGLSLPDLVSGTGEKYILHPVLLDSALHATAGLMVSKKETAAPGEETPLKPSIPFALEELKIYSACTPRMWASVRFCEGYNQESELIKIDINLYDEEGSLCIQISGFTARAFENGRETGDSGETEKHGTEKMTALSAGSKQTDLPLEDERPAAGGSDYGLFEKKALNYFKKAFSNILKLPVHRINEHAGLEKYGVDSLTVMTLTRHLEEDFGTLPKTLFFEYKNIAELTGYFLTSYKKRLEEILQVEHKRPLYDTGVIPAGPAAPKKTGKEQKRIPRIGPVTQNRFDTKNRKDPDIAIIGMSGRYPGAETVEEFWDNLKNGKDGLSEIPKERWDNSDYFAVEKNTSGKSYCKYGGFLKDVDRFDPLFFNISPKEAELMDPKERLFLETSWALFENSGYTGDRLEKVCSRKVGVFVGAMYQQYHSFQTDPVRKSMISLSSYNSIANRVSYFFDLQGPSMAVDTACSSSLLAVHLACQSILKGECSMAVAGGVNLSIHPGKYVALSQTGMLGSSPGSVSFADGDGYIPSEAVGALLLKPVEQAVKDGDPILALIKSSHTNHGGRSNAFMVPNLNGQTALIEENFRKSGIDPRTISYVEAGANGSALGDPIELGALEKVFSKAKCEKHFCPIGSVKSNIGHAEAASGISQITKVILQLQHKLLVPSIKADPLNPNLTFENSPFFLQDKKTEWKKPLIKTGGIDGYAGEEEEIPRRATVSSFGAGGSNVHIILEEYQSTENDKGQNRSLSSGEEKEKEHGPYLFVFSAKTRKSLHKQVKNMLYYFQTHKEADLSRAAYTLQLGRETMETRTALIVSDREQLIEDLQKMVLFFEQNLPLTENTSFFYGESEEGPGDVQRLMAGNAGKALVQVLLNENETEKLLLYWCQGGDVPWDFFYTNRQMTPIVLPGYSFNKRRCWINSGIEPGVFAESRFEEKKIKEKVKGKKETGKTPASGSIADIVIRDICDLSGLEAKEINPKKALSGYGFDSILFVRLFQQLQVHLEITLPIESMAECRTIENIIEKISAISGEKEIIPEKVTPEVSPIINIMQKYPELVPLNGNKAGKPVFWFHGGVGGVESYQEIAGKSKRPFYGIQAKGWLTDRAPLKGLEAMASYYIKIIGSVQPEGPYDLGGFSLGGALAYEVTRQLQKRGKKVDSILMVDSLDSKGLKKTELTYKTAAFQAVNLTLLSSVLSIEDPAALQKLIHRDEVSPDLEDEPFLKELIKLGKKRGLTKNIKQITSLIKQTIKVQSSYEVDKYRILPLDKPGEVSCYYIRNRQGLFFGNLEPFLTLQAGEISLDSISYWEEWEKELPGMEIVDVDASCHLTMLTEEAVMKVIFEYIERLYT